MISPSLLAFAVLAFVNEVPNGNPEFVRLGDLPGGAFGSHAHAVSADGRTVVGECSTSEPEWPYRSRACRWRDGVPEPLETAMNDEHYAVAAAVSGDGELVVGSIADHAWRDGVAVVWRGPGTAEVLPFPTPGPDQTYVESTAIDVSLDGRIILGRVRSDLAGGAAWEAVLWIDGEVNALPAPCSWSQGDGVCRPNAFPVAISLDGTVVVGSANYVPVRWVNGAVEPLQADNPLLQGAEDVSGDGTVVVGVAGGVHVGRSYQAFRWSNGETEYLAPVEAYCGSCWAYAVSGDGKLVAGSCSGRSGTFQFLWDPAGGMRSLGPGLEQSYDVIPAGFTLLSFSDVSADGRTIVGSGTNEEGNYEAWLVRLPVPPNILSSDPEDGLIDARADFSTSSLSRRGIDRIRITTSSVVTNLSGDGPPDAGSFRVTDTSSTSPPVLEVVPVAGRPFAYDVVLVDPIKPGHWTTIALEGGRTDGVPFADFSTAVTIGFLPGDVNGSGTSNAGDIAALIDALNGVPGKTRPVTSTDINWSGAVNTQDVARLIELLNGVNSSRVWRGQRLP